SPLSLSSYFSSLLTHLSPFLLLCPPSLFIFLFFFNDPPPTEIYTLSLHDALPICARRRARGAGGRESACSRPSPAPGRAPPRTGPSRRRGPTGRGTGTPRGGSGCAGGPRPGRGRKSARWRPWSARAGTSPPAARRRDR